MLLKRRQCLTPAADIAKRNKNPADKCAGRTRELRATYKIRKTIAAMNMQRKHGPLNSSPRLCGTRRETVSPN